MKIIINEELCTKIELLQYEVNSRKEIITAYLNADIAKTVAFEEYQKEYTNCFTEYNRAKQEMLNLYNVPTKSNWSLDFATRELTYEEA